MTEVAFTPAGPQRPIAGGKVMNAALYRRRGIYSLVGWVICGVFFLLLAISLLDILLMVVSRGGGSLSWKLVSEPGNGIVGGLLNAIEGTFVLTIGSLIIAVPIGVAAGIYVAEYSAGWFARMVLYLSDVLVGVPSIVLGLFGYIVFVTSLGWQFSVLAGCITLGILISPYILRTTELAFRGVPSALREAAYSLGAGHARVTLQVMLRACGSRVLTGILLAMAISMGETAPLIYTVNFSNYMWSGRLTHEPIAYLTYLVWSSNNVPQESAHRLAYGAALLITVFVLLVTIAARVSLHYFSSKQR